VQKQVLHKTAVTDRFHVVYVTDLPTVVSSVDSLQQQAILHPVQDHTTEHPSVELDLPSSEEQQLKRYLGNYFCFLYYATFPL